MRGGLSGNPKIFHGQSIGVIATVIVWVYSLNGARTRPQGVAVQSISKYFGRNALWLAVAPGHAVGVNGHASNQPAWL